LFTTDSEFEDEIRRVARLLWPIAQFDGAAIVEGRERDGVFETDDVVNIVECTVSRSKQKAVDDCEKIDKLVKKLTPKISHKFVRGWFITLHEPTAEQRGVARKASCHRIQSCSYDQFRAKLIDARSYLTKRKSYAFGSVRDPESDNINFDPKYIGLDILDEKGSLYTLDALGSLVEKGKHVVILGDYGAGKSSTIRELYFELAKKFWTNNHNQFPIVLNLRDHHGQTDPVEAIERHARKIGFTPESSLVCAWRAGFATILLDGFDEIASAGWAGKTTKLKDLRYRSMELIRQFIVETPTSSGIILAGRAHFFDNPRELNQALGLKRDVLLVSISEFNINQVQAFLHRTGWSGSIPEWLPTRPLLLAYLVSRGLLLNFSSEEYTIGPVEGWNELISRICKREAEIEAGIDPDIVKHLIEQLASIARGTIDGLGPLAPDVIIKAFKDVCGYPPDDKGAVLLQRLPGLGSSQAEDGSRYFIDKDFAQAAKAGALTRYIEDPFVSNLQCDGWQSTLPELGLEIAAHQCKIAKFNKGKISAAINLAHDDKRFHTLCADLIMILMKSGYSYDGNNIYLNGVWVQELRFEDPLDFKTVEFQDCVIATIEINNEILTSLLPIFRKCHVAQFDGRTGLTDIPQEQFIECTFSGFESATNTTSAILNLSLPLSTRVLLTILKKMFAQSGRGRKETALFRGLEPRAQQLVPKVLQVLRRENIIVSLRQGSETIWLPTKASGCRKRALGLLSSPATSRDSLILKSREIE
jgi:hypothetical protein